MKRYLLGFFLGVFILSGLFTLGIPTAKAASIKLNLSDVFPATHEQHTTRSWAPVSQAQYEGSNAKTGVRIRRKIWYRRCTPFFLPGTPLRA